MMGKTVDEFLLERYDGLNSPKGLHVVQVLVMKYRMALNSRNWPACTVLGNLMIDLAKPFKDHPDYRTDWTP